MRDVMKHLGHFEFKSLDGTDSGRMLEGDRIRFFGWANDEKYWLREIAGVGERILPADCFGNPILSKRED